MKSEERSEPNEEKKLEILHGEWRRRVERRRKSRKKELKVIQ